MRNHLTETITPVHDRKLLTGTELTIKQCACMRFLGRKMLNFNCVWTIASLFFMLGRVTFFLYGRVTFFLYGRVTFFHVGPCHIFLYGRVTFFPVRPCHEVCVHTYSRSVLYKVYIKFYG